MNDYILRGDRSANAVSLVALLVGVLGIIYLFNKSIVADWKDFDFLYIWLSGHLWAQGISPYGAEYMEQGNILFGTLHRQPFYYPPGFWFVSRFFALFEYQIAVEIWRWTSVGLLLVSSLILKTGLGNAGIKISWPIIIFYTGLVSLMQATVLTFILGQTSIFIYFSVCVVVYSILSRNSLLLAVGLSLVLLKPTVGAGLFVALLPFAIFRKSIILTVLCSVIMALPALLPFGVVNTISTYIKGVSGHGDFFANKAEVTTGFRNILYHLTEIELSGTVALLITIVGILVTMIIIARTGVLMKEDDAYEKKMFVLALSLSMIGFLAPLHVYDFILFAPVLLLTQKLDKYTWIAIFLLFLVMARSQNITFEAVLFSQHDRNLWAGGELSTIASFITSILIATAAARQYKRSVENT